MTMGPATCGACGADIIWCEVRGRRSRHPVDAEPNPWGGWQVVDINPWGVPVIVAAERLRGELFPLETASRYRTHFATCMPELKNPTLAQRMDRARTVHVTGGLL
jgi:hypothetical protein